MSVALSLSVYSERPTMQPPVCSSTSHVLAPFRRWASANIDALHEADGKTKQKTKKLQTAVLHPPARASRDHWGAAASHSSFLCLLASLSLSLCSSSPNAFRHSVSINPADLKGSLCRYAACESGENNNNKKLWETKQKRKKNNHLLV